MNRLGSVGTVAKFALILVAIIVAQGILSLKFQVFAFFDLPLIYCIYYGFTLASPAGSIAIGSALGLMQDSLSGSPLGTNGFSKTLIGFLAASSGRKFDVDQSITRALAFVLFTFMDAAAKLILAAVTRPGDLSAEVPGLGVWILSAAFNALLGLILFGYRSRFRDATA